MTAHQPIDHGDRAGPSEWIRTLKSNGSLLNSLINNILIRFYCYIGYNNVSTVVYYSQLHRNH